jgi:methyl-accepting chemotaxis protein
MRMTLSKKLYGLAGIVLLALVIVSGMSLFGQWMLINGYKTLADVDGAKMEASKEAANQLGQAVQAYKTYLIRGEDRYAKEFRERMKLTGDELEKFAKLVKNETEKEVYANAKDAFNAYERALDPLVEARKKTRDVAVLDSGIGSGADMRLRIALEDMDEVVKKHYLVFKEQLNKNATRMSLLQIALTIVAVIIGVVLCASLIRVILKSITAVKIVAEKAATGDLSQEVAVTTNDEIGEMARSFNTMVVNLRRIVGEINTTTASLAGNSEELSATSDDMSKGARELSSQTEQVVTAMTEVSQTIMDMAKNASLAAEASKNASDTALQGKKIVDNTAEDMVKIAQTVQEAAGTIEELGKSSAQIGEIVAVINGIADQTNLLALNAAIEAARAGEQGRGFAVVADEVRKLAERTSQATKDITQRIASIQSAAGESVDAMKRGSDEVDKGVGMAKEASASLDTIVTSSTNAMDMVQRIAAATEQQSAASEEVTQSMESISGISRQSSASTDQIKVSSGELAKLAAGLKAMTAFFKS